MSELEAIKSFLMGQLDNVKDDDIKETMQVLLSQIDTHDSLDQDFIELLRILADGDGATLHKVNKYAVIAEELDQNSTVIYFKSAGLFRVYQSKDLEQYFVNRTGAEFKNQDEIYEVINDSKPQKIVIIIDSRDKAELVKIKQYILDFSKEIKTPVSKEDLIVFDNTPENTYEIVVNSWVVSNDDYREVLLSKFIKYCNSRSTYHLLGNKVKRPTCIGILGTVCYLVPQKKILLSGNQYDGYVARNIDINLIDNVRVPLVNRLKSVDSKGVSSILSYIISETKTKLNNLIASGKFKGNVDLAVYLEPTIDKEPTERDQHVYLIQEREHKRLGEPVYKIGRTTQALNKRMNAYPKNSKHFASKAVHDCVKVEKLLIKQFDSLFKNRPDIGREYYEGSIKNMISAFDMITRLNMDI